MLTELHPEIRNLLAEAAEWRLLELLFQCPSPDWRRCITRLAEEVRDPLLREAANLAAEQGHEAVFHSLLGPGGPAPGREVSYHTAIPLGYLMAEISAYYQAFAFEPVGVEPPDHVSVEAGFLGYLKLKQACARACGEEEPVMIAAEAGERFRCEHLAFIAEPLSTALDQSGERYLELAGQALLRRAGPRGKQMFEILDNEAMNLDEELFECGAS
jgi:nitrate reductase assembly molybdenum cofactor insertion protein NarJ